MISSERVSELFMECLFKDEEIVDNKPILEPIFVKGIMTTNWLHPERVKESALEIEGFIKELPEKFKNGWTFLGLCQTKDGDFWTDLHQVCEDLMVLGMAINKIEYCSSRETWVNLPGGMPYVRVIE